MIRNSLIIIGVAISVIFCLWVLKNWIDSSTAAVLNNFVTACQLIIKDATVQQCTALYKISPVTQ